jgi:2-keto-4-pentenoate hydratase
MLEAVEPATAAHIFWHPDGPRRTIEPLAVILEENGNVLNAMAFDDGDTVNLSGFYYPHIEAKVAFVLGDALPGENCTEFHVVNATKYVVPAIGLSNSLFRHRHVGIAEPARIVLGWQQRSLADINISDIAVVLYSGYRCREVEMMRGNSRATHDDPITAAARLAHAAARRGIRLQAGDTISASSWTRAVDVAVGDRFRAEFGGLGEVSVEFCGGGTELTLAAAE